MPRMQVYLPDDLYAQLKGGAMSASQLLQDAVRREVRKQELNRLADEYLAEMDALYGPVTPEEAAAADQWLTGVEDQLRAADRDLPARPAGGPGAPTARTAARTTGTRNAGTHNAGTRKAS